MRQQLGGKNCCCRCVASLSVLSLSFSSLQLPTTQVLKKSLSFSRTHSLTADTHHRRLHDYTTTTTRRTTHSLTLSRCSSHFDLLSPSGSCVCVSCALSCSSLRAPALALSLLSPSSPAVRWCSCSIETDENEILVFCERTVSVRRWCSGTLTHTEHRCGMIKLLRLRRSPFAGLFLTGCLHTHTDSHSHPAAGAAAAGGGSCCGNLLLAPDLTRSDAQQFLSHSVMQVLDLSLSPASAGRIVCRALKIDIVLFSFFLAAFSPG